MRKLHIAGLIAVVFLVSGIAAFGQAEAGSISGTVRDATGAAIAGATVTARNVATAAERTMQTGPDGGYALTGLTPATYQITIGHPRFASFQQEAVVSVGGHQTVDAQLAVSAVTTEVHVVSEATTEINTQTQEVSQIVTPEQVAQLPSLTRNPYDFVALAGNISGGDRGMANGNPQLTGAGQNNTDRGVGFSLNGQRASGTEILLDGAENIDLFDTTIGLLVPQDSVQEFRVITNNFDAQYGRASGGVVNVVTKSGTNNFHGDAWEYNRLSAYTANTFDNDVNGVPKGQYTRNQFGYDIGGPIKKDKLFFYQSTEWLRVRSAASVLAYVPTPELLALTPPNVQSFFKTYGSQSFNFINTIPASAVTGTPGPLFAGVAPTTPAFGLVNYTSPVDAGGDVPQNTYELLGRVDYNLSANTRMFFRYGRESLDALPGSISSSPYQQYNVGQTIYNDNYLLSANHTFSSNVLSSTKLSFFRDTVAEQYNVALQNTPTLFLYNNANIAGQPVQLPGFATGGLPYGGPQNTVQINQDVSWSKGTHTMHFGGQYNYIQLNRGYGAYAQSNQQLGTDLPTGLEGLMSGSLVNFQVAANPGGKFPCSVGAYSGRSEGALIPTPECTLTPPLTAPNFNRSDRYNDWALYAEDSWRVTPRFTFNYGARYEHFGVQHNNDPSLDSNFYFGPGSTFFQQVQTGSVQLAANSPVGGLWKPTWGTVGPRIGFAYDLTGNGNTVLRGGYGISYERNFGNVTFNVLQNPPNNATVQVSNVPVSVNNLGPLAGGAGVPPNCGTALCLPPVSPRNVDQGIQTAQTQFWGLVLEHRLGNKAVVALEYNGAHGVHLYDVSNINELGGAQAFLGAPVVTSDPNNPACSAASPCLTRPNQQFTAINNRGSNGFSHYNGLNVRFQTQQFGNTGLSIVSNFTWAHSMDNISSTFSESSSGINGVGNLGFLNPMFPRLDYGNSDFDIRDRLALSMIWIEPFFKGSKTLLREVAGGWTIAPIFTARTGAPFTISDSTNSLNFGLGGIPRYAPAGAISTFQTGPGVDQGGNVFNLLSLPAATEYVGLNATAANPFGYSDFGPYPANMTTRNQFYGPGAWNLDFSLSKNFPVTERIALQFRAEAYDIFNHHNMYVDGFAADAANFSGAPVDIVGKMGGLGSLANNGQHDERRFLQFALRAMF